MTDKEKKTRWQRGLRWFGARVVKVGEKLVENVLLLIVLTIVSGGGLLLGLVKSALGHRDLLLLLSGVVLGLAVVGLVLAGAISLWNRYHDARAVARDLELAIETGEYAKAHIYDVLEALQQAIADADEAFDINELVERGVLGPARGFLTRAALGDVRLAVLWPDAQDFTMRWAVGHTPAGKRRFRRPIDEMLAGRAFRSGELVHVRDVEADDTFSPNPRASRSFRSLVAVPIRTGEEIVGALSVVATNADAFTSTDISFIKIVSAVLDLLLALDVDDARRLGAILDAMNDPGEGTTDD